MSEIISDVERRAISAAEKEGFHAHEEALLNLLEVKRLQDESSAVLLLYGQLLQLYAPVDSTKALSVIRAMEQMPKFVEDGWAEIVARVAYAHLSNYVSLGSYIRLAIADEAMEEGVDYASYYMTDKVDNFRSIELWELIEKSPSDARVEQLLNRFYMRAATSSLCYKALEKSMSSAVAKGIRSEAVAGISKRIWGDLMISLHFGDRTEEQQASLRQRIEHLEAIIRECKTDN